MSVMEMLNIAAVLSTMKFTRRSAKSLCAGGQDN
jgi:hypothetical protein